MKVTLYKCNASGNISVWSIEPERNVLVIRHGRLHGLEQVKTEVVTTNMSGRGIEDQVTLRMRSRINKQLDKGYCTSIDDARANSGTNALRLKLPMLALKYRDVRSIDYRTSFLQHKYNGHRCMITRVGDEVVAYSRNGKVITTIDHITDKLDIPEGHTLDGELYCHGVPLQTIASWVKRKQPNTTKLSYILYDTMLSADYTSRMAVMANYDLPANVTIAPTQQFGRGDKVEDMLHTAIESGYEGLILRQNNYSYQSGVRSQSLVKIKQFMDNEYKVIDILESKDHWAILVCQLPDKRTFRVSSPGTIDDKRYVLDNKHLYLGMHINVEYFELTPDGIPFHPVATYWRKFT